MMMAAGGASNACIWQRKRARSLWQWNACMRSASKHARPLAAKWLRPWLEWQDLRKADYFLLASLWSYRSDIWVPKKPPTAASASAACDQLAAPARRAAASPAARSSDQGGWAPECHERPRLCSIFSDTTALEPPPLLCAWGALGDDDGSRELLRRRNLLLLDPRQTSVFVTARPVAPRHHAPSRAISVPMRSARHAAFLQPQGAPSLAAGSSAPSHRRIRPNPTTGK